jgi:hypothetical protein
MFVSPPLLYVSYDYTAPASQIAQAPRHTAIAADQFIEIVSQLLTTAKESGMLFLFLIHCIKLWVVSKMTGMRR